MRRARSLRNGVHHADAVVWGPVYRTRLHHLRQQKRRRDVPARVFHHPDVHLGEDEVVFQAARRLRVRALALRALRRGPPRPRVDVARILVVLSHLRKLLHALVQQPHRVVDEHVQEPHVELGVANRELAPRDAVRLHLPEVLAHLADLVPDVELVVKLIRGAGELDVDVEPQHRRDQVLQRELVALEQVRHRGVPAPARLGRVAGEPVPQHLHELRA
eukprot:30889-Pelagococcus_subviridis.AAC.8